MAATTAATDQVLATVGPLPTAFTLSASCTNETFVNFIEGTNGEIDLWNLGQTCDYNRASLTVKDGCLPGKYKTAFEGIGVGKVSPVFSPATACPAGYNPSCTRVGPMESEMSSATVWGALSSGQVAIGCCPTGFHCASEDEGYYCVSCVTSGQVFTVTDVSNCQRNSHGDAETRIVSTTVKSASVCGGYIPQIVYIRQSTAPTTTNTTTTTSTQAGPSSSTTTSSTSSSSLSAGAKAGISIAVALVVILFLTAVLMLYSRRKRSKIATPPEPGAQNAYAKPELDSEEKARSELPGSSARICELLNETQIPGPSHATVAELDGGEVTRPLAPLQTTTMPRTTEA